MRWKAQEGSDNREDWPRLFEQHFNAGEVEAAIELYEPGARFVGSSGETIVGRDVV